MGLLDQQQQEEREEGGGYISPQMLQQGYTPSQDFFLFRLDSADIIEEIQHQLKGEVYISNDNGGGEWVKKYQRAMTDEGISEVVSMIYACGINKNTILGNLTKDEIYSRCRRVGKALLLYFANEGDRIGVTIKNRNLLIVKIVQMVHSGLSRSEGGREADQLSSAIQKVEHNIHQEQSQKSNSMLGGMARALNPFNRGR